jgi:type IV pilus assembly protein PilN
MIEINLLPVREARRKADLRQQALLLAGTLIGSVALSGAVHAWMVGRTVSANHQVRKLEQEIAKFGSQLQQVEDFRRKKAEIEQKLAVIDQLDRSRSGPVHVLDELAIHTPDRVWLTKVRSEEASLSIDGVSLDNELVALFLTALNESPYFDAVELQETKLVERDRLKLNSFKIRARLTTPGLPEPAATAEAAPAKGGKKPARARKAG